jgi:AcrR family transcriptional regulator
MSAPQTTAPNAKIGADHQNAAWSWSFSLGLPKLERSSPLTDRAYNELERSPPLSRYAVGVRSIAPSFPAAPADSTALADSAAPALSAEPTDPPARPLRRDAERNRQRILAAAAEVFAARGLDVSLDDIAKHAGLGVGTVYRRFPTKEALIESLFEEHVGTLAEMAESVSYAENSWDGLVCVLTEVCALQASNQGLREILVSSTYGQGCAARARARLMPAIEKGLQRAQEDGYLRPGIAPVDMVLIEFMIGGVAGYTKQHPDAWRRYLQIILDGLRARPDLAAPATAALTSDELNEAILTWRPPRRPTASNVDASVTAPVPSGGSESR